jgi:hypothetical protein
MNTKLSFKKPPIKEVQGARSWTFEKFLFTETYADTLSSAEKLVRTKRPQTSNQEWLHFRTLLVHECEMAKSWKRLWDSKDDPQRAAGEWLNNSDERRRSVNKFIDNLRIMDKRQGYDLRDMFFSSAQIAMSPRDENLAFMSDQNLPEGGFEVPTGGRVAQAVELQFLSRLFLGQFDQWLDALKKEIETRNTGFRLGRRIGPMFLDPPISDVSMAKLDSTQLAILALTGRLRKALTLVASAGRSTMPNYDSLGGDMPTKPVAAWKIIMSFIQIAFESETTDLTEAALKERWSNATKGRKISFSGWPEAVERQATE